MYHFFAYLSRMKHILRWGLMRNTQPENIKEHSFDVAMIAHALAVIRNTYFEGQIDEGHVLALALYHEAGEVFTGDLATPVKYFNPQIKKAYGQMESYCLDKLLHMLPEELTPNYRPLLFHEADPDYVIVKAADKLCAYIKCIEEMKCNNAEFEKAKHTIAAQLNEIALPEVQYFMDNFLPGYSLSLDELN